MSDKACGAKIRLVAVDMDGTALKSDGQVSPGTIEALNEWIKEGVVVVPASGRTYSWIPEEILGLGVPYVISGNGASVIDTGTGEYMYESKIKLKEGMDLLSYLLTENGQCYFQQKDQYYEDGNRSEEMEKIHPYMASVGFSRKGKLMDPLGFLKDKGEDIQKIGFMAFDEETEKRVAACGRRFPDFCILKTGPLCLEFNRKGTSKGEALKYLCHTIGIKQDQVMAIGDSENDVEMLACAGIGVAMENAPEKVKNAADFVTKTNDQEGVAWVLEHVLRRS
ncbi:Cof-type HAD-IIB family hydrolase [Lacrimispora sp.]|uniref:Cof-type HAD-IIB family hydrolase n=1 Tax=Lacrimispora sp. TaxID=2719234 RepID=UPI002FD935F7